MMRIRITADAERDLDEIFAWWSEHASLETADRIVDAIVERFALLSEFPLAGRACDEIAPGVRCFPAGPHLIYYRKTRRALEVLHIFHAAREQSSAFTQPRRRD